MIERTKYLLLIIKTYFETKNPSASNPSENLFDLQITLIHQALIRKQKIAEQKEFVTKDEFFLQCELALDELREYGYMQFSIDANKLQNKNESHRNKGINGTEEEQIKFIQRQVNDFLVDLSGLDSALQFQIHNWEIEFLIEIFENFNFNLPEQNQPEQNAEIFSNNGFELFEHILYKYVSPINTRGRKSDLIFYYWKLYNSKPRYIHQRPATFFNWFEEEYDEMTGQLKTFDKVKTIQRERDFSLALEWFKSK